VEEKKKGENSFFMNAVAPPLSSFRRRKKGKKIKNRFAR
jgi:hypothetical protein